MEKIRKYCYSPRKEYANSGVFRSRINALKEATRGSVWLTPICDDLREAAAANLRIFWAFVWARAGLELIGQHWHQLILSRVKAKCSFHAIRFPKVYFYEMSANIHKDGCPYSIANFHVRIYTVVKVLVTVCIQRDTIRLALHGNRP